MYKTILTIMLLLTSMTCFSQSLLEPKPISWQELKDSQSQVVEGLKNDFQLSPQCFQGIESYKKLSFHIFMQNILWNTYLWKRYEVADGPYCTILIENFGTKNESSKVLTIFETEVLLSASKGLGFDENGFYKYSNEINLYNIEYSSLLGG